MEGVSTSCPHSGSAHARNCKSHSSQTNPWCHDEETPEHRQAMTHSLKQDCQIKSYAKPSVFQSMKPPVYLMKTICILHRKESMNYVHHKSRTKIKPQHPMIAAINNESTTSAAAKSYPLSLSLSLSLPLSLSLCRSDHRDICMTRNGTTLYNTK